MVIFIKKMLFLNILLIAFSVIGKEKVQVIGDSLTNGIISANYVYQLENRYYKDYIFYKEGVNGDLSYNLLKRTSRLVKKNPDKVIILIGSNDVLSQFSPFFYQNNKLPRRPSVKWYKKNLTKIINLYLKNEISDMALVSIPPIGERLDSKHNLMIYSINNYIKSMADQYGLTYIPFGEKLVNELKMRSTFSKRKCGTFELGQLLFKSRYYYEVEKLSWNNISDKFGFFFSVDCIHINDRAAGILVDLLKQLYLN